MKRMMVETLDGPCDSGPCTLKYRQCDHMVEDIQRFETLSILDSRLYELVTVLIKQKYIIAS